MVVGNTRQQYYVVGTKEVDSTSHERVDRRGIPYKSDTEPYSCTQRSTRKKRVETRDQE